jgi:hypothetical protein
MEIIKEYNKNKYSESKKPNLAPVKCDKCCSQMYYTGIGFPVYPMRYEVKCTNCGFTSSIL